MKRAKRLLTGFLLGSFFLNGCSRNSSLQVVVPKKEQDSVLLSQEDVDSVQEQVQAPVRYLCDKDFSNFRLVANARVIVPETEGIRLKKIKSRNFSKEDLARLQKAVLDGGIFYELKRDEDYENVAVIAGTGEIGEGSDKTTEVSNQEAYSGQTQAVEEQLPEDIEGCFRLFQDFMDGKKTFCFDTEEDFLTLEKLFLQAAEEETDWKNQMKLIQLSMVCDEFSTAVQEGLLWEKQELSEISEEKEAYGIVLQKDNVTFCNMQNDYYIDGGRSSVQFSMSPPYGDILSENQAGDLFLDEAEEIHFHEENLAEVDLQKQGRELMRALGLEKTELWEVRDETLFSWNRSADIYEEANKEPVRRFDYCRDVDGVPLLDISDQDYFYIQEDDLMNWPPEKISAVYGIDGLVSFTWTAPVEIEDWQDEEVFLLPFSEISQIFEEMLEGSLTMDTGGLIGDLNVSEVRLGYVRVISRELLQEDTNVSEENGQETYTGVLVPAWSFIGTATGSVADAYGVQEGTRISYMTINAMDGSIIRD